MKSVLFIPKYNIEVILEYKNNKIKVVYLPESCYTDEEIEKEVKIIIERMME